MPYHLAWYLGAQVDDLKECIDRPAYLGPLVCQDKRPLKGGWLLDDIFNDLFEVAADRCLVQFRLSVGS